MNITIKKSHKKEKKYDAIITDHTGKKKIIPFGQAGKIDYTLGATKEKREMYIKRHTKRENWNEINAGSLSRFILWGDSPNIETNIREYKKKFNLK